MSQTICTSASNKQERLPLKLLNPISDKRKKEVSDWT